MTTTSSPSSAATGRSAALAGIGFMLVAVFLFAFNSAAGKWLVAKYPVGEFMLMRGFFALLYISPLIWLAGRSAFANAPRPGLEVKKITLDIRSTYGTKSISHLNNLNENCCFFLTDPRT